MIRIILFITGIFIFLIALHLLNKALEKTMSPYLLGGLQKLTSIKYVAILYGMVITMLLQSSSIVLVCLIGLVKTRYINVLQAMWILMGANIGTTLTNHLIVLDLSLCIPLLMLTGVFLFFMKEERYFYIGMLCQSIALLFISFDIMQYSVLPMQHNTYFYELLYSLENPLVGLIFGIITTAILQSSSASIAIMQSFVAVQPMPLSWIVWILYGQNIGTCFTGLLAMVDANKQAKQVMIVQFLINIIGMILFIPIAYGIDLVMFIENLAPNDLTKQIANMNTIYNITIVLLLLPLDKVIVYISDQLLD